MGNPKALIVEDEIIIALNLQFMLKELGYDSTIVNNGSDAIREAKEKNPQLILMDISLKGSLSGIDAAASLSDTDIPIIFVTAFMNKETLLRTKVVENHSFLIKPIFLQDLRKEINKIFDNGN